MCQNNARPTTGASPIDDQDVDGYRYETFRAALLLNDARFSPDSLKPGQVLPDRTLVRPDGEEISLRHLSGGRPIALVTGSLTCPLSHQHAAAVRRVEPAVRRSCRRRRRLHPRGPSR